MLFKTSTFHCLKLNCPLALSDNWNALHNGNIKITMITPPQLHWVHLPLALKIVTISKTFFLQLSETTSLNTQYTMQFIQPQKHSFCSQSWTAHFLINSTNASNMSSVITQWLYHTSSLRFPLDGNWFLTITLERILQFVVTSLKAVRRSKLPGFIRLSARKCGLHFAMLQRWVWKQNNSFCNKARELDIILLA